MADAYVGRVQYLAIGPAANNLTVISGTGNGLAEVSFNRSNEVREIPGGDIRRQHLGNIDWSMSFTVDANATTWPLLYLKDTVFYSYGPRGNANGSVKHTGELVLDTNDVSSNTNEAQVFSISGSPKDGNTEGTYP